MSAKARATAGKPASRGGKEPRPGRAGGPRAAQPAESRVAERPEQARATPSHPSSLVVSRPVQPNAPVFREEAPRENTDVPRIATRPPGEPRPHKAQVGVSQRPTTLRELLAQARALLGQGAHQEDLVGLIVATADYHGIRVRRDAVGPPSIVDQAATQGPEQPAQAPSEPVPTQSEPVPEQSAQPAPAPAQPAPEQPAQSEPVPTQSESAPAQSEHAPAASPVSVPAADPCAGPTGTPSKSARKKKSGRKRQTLPVTIVRLEDGSHRMCVKVAPDDPEPPKSAPPRDLGSPRVWRLVLSCSERAGQLRGAKGAPIQHECNGLVLDAVTLRVLSMPPGAFHLNPAAAALNPLLAQGAYDIIRADDGTVLTLYYWRYPGGQSGERSAPGHWCLSSSNGYDVSTLKWCGDRTFAEIFADLATKYYPRFVSETGLRLDSGRLSFTHLDESRCYTVGLRHHDFHPILADPERLWVIQVTDLSGDLPRVDRSARLYDLPPQEVLANPHRLAEIAARRRENRALAGRTASAPGDWPTLQDLISLGDDSKDRALDYIARQAASAGPGSPEGQVTPVRALPSDLHYGFILRSRDPGKTLTLSDILIESPFLTRVRKLLYDRPPRHEQDSVTASDRSEYTAMRAYLAVDNRADYLALRPQLSQRFQVYDGFVRSLIQLVAHSLRQRALGPASREPPLRTPIGQVASSLLEHVWKHERLTGFHKDSEAIVRDYVTHPQYALLYIRALRIADARRGEPADRSEGGAEPGE